jgi:cell fate regulator YaaT (PSP1 superfamily)
MTEINLIPKIVSLIRKNKKKQPLILIGRKLSRVRPARYLGFMAYEGDDYKEATKYFDAVSGEEKYKEKLSYYQADMNFKL